MKASTDRLIRLGVVVTAVTDGLVIITTTVMMGITLGTTIHPGCQVRLVLPVRQGVAARGVIPTLLQ